MAEFPDWLPPLITLKEYDGNWWAYIEACYERYCQDFIKCEEYPSFKGKVVWRDNRITDNGWEETFRHIVYGSKKNKIAQDISRLEKIRWVRPIIKAGNDDTIPWWRNVRPSGRQRGPQERLVIALPDFTYKVIMNERHDNFILFDAYTCYGYEIVRMKQEYDEWRNRL